MKHVKVGEQLRNLEKNWSHLKLKQKAWIIHSFREGYTNFLSKNLRHPNKDECSLIVSEVYSMIEEKDIWIPYSEVKKACSKKLNKYRKISLPLEEV